jgi:hypothetical protein
MEPSAQQLELALEVYDLEYILELSELDHLIVLLCLASQGFEIVLPEVVPLDLENDQLFQERVGEEE